MLVLCLLILLQISSANVRGQATTEGFVSIDCGSSRNYTDSTTGISYLTDDEFTDAGTNHPISSNFKSTSQQLLTVRSFAGAPRSCYILRPVTMDQKYIVRALFYYGNYDADGDNDPDGDAAARAPKFDLYVDVNFWQTVDVDNPWTTYVEEATVVALRDSLAVCLVNTGAGTPFMSALELRPLADAMYPAVTSMQYLVLAKRVDYRADDSGLPLRFPSDPFDRMWWPQTGSWAQIVTSQEIDTSGDDDFQPPSAVLQTAITPINSSVMEFQWTFEDVHVPNNEFFVNFFFAELKANTTRTFDVYLNGVRQGTVTPPYLSVTNQHWGPLLRSLEFHWAFNSTGLSSLPPILNAYEFFTAMHLTQESTDERDIDAITAIKEQYQVKKSWLADPCAPVQYPWTGLNCSYTTNQPRITAVNLSSSGLTGTISSSFAMLTEIIYLDLSYNNLTGSIPDALGTLTSLQVLNLSGNNLNGTIPDSLLKLKSFRYDGNLNLTTSGSTSNGSKKKIKATTIVLICVLPAVLVLLVVVTFFVLRIRKTSESKQPITPVDYNRRQFTQKDLEKITNNFTTVLGKGGFGTVFLGYLEDIDRQIAVKLRSQSSSQGTREFLAEAQNLTKIHHKNLVSLVGYCMDGDHMALIYEYMSFGTLQDHLRGKICSAISLSWGQRLHVAVDAAQGLEYLHHGCKPALIHRDVKSANILLSDTLEAKISDFGMSRAFHQDHCSSTSTSVVGTPGYLDPEYHSFNQLSEKSDVYSFGVVLFELMTGKPPFILVGNQSVALVHWASQMLGKGNVDDIVDLKLQRMYDINSIWKVADIALRCTEYHSRKRPTMTQVTMELKESLALESASYSNDNFQYTNNKGLEIETTPGIKHAASRAEELPSFLPIIKIIHNVLFSQGKQVLVVKI